MAHISDTQIQAHSVGPLYPYVIYRQEFDGTPTWCVTGPGFDLTGCTTYDEAFSTAQMLKEKDDVQK